METVIRSDVQALEVFLNEDLYELNGFNPEDEIYINTNEKLRDYYEPNLENKRVLSVTSSGDHILHAALAGSKDIVGFDLNRFCKYYAALKIAMIKTFSYEEFCHNMELVSSLNYYKANRLNCEIFYESAIKEINEIESMLDKVSKYLTKEEYLFWKYCIRLYRNKKVNGYIFVPSSDGIDTCLYDDKVVYNKLSKKLMDCNISYVDSSIMDLNKNNGVFNFMYISNILDYVAKEEITQIINNLSSMLNKNGKINLCIKCNTPYKSIIFRIAYKDSFSNDFDFEEHRSDDTSYYIENYITLTKK